MQRVIPANASSRPARESHTAVLLGSLTTPADTPALTASVPTLGRRVVAEAIGTALLLAIVVGSGIAAQGLADGNAALALLVNAIATGVGLVALILAFSRVSGAHFNPLVTLSMLLHGRCRRHELLAYVVAQFAGALLGVAAAHLMFGEPLYVASHAARAGYAQWWSECVATFGLLTIIHGAAAHGARTVAMAVGGYITAAYWFTASTAFANPAATLARAFTDTFAGIRPGDALGFMLAQIAGAVAATLLMRWLDAGVGRRRA